jgi:hypothetical protein
MLTKLEQNGADHIDLGGKLPCPTPQTFAVEACAPGRYVLQFGARRDVAAELKRKLCRVTAIAVPEKQYRNGHKPSAPPVHLPENIGWFDEILLMDLIEHLPDAKIFMKKLRKKMARRGSEVIITVANVACCVSRIARVFLRPDRGGEKSLAGRDRRSFTFKSLRALLESAGYEIVEARGLPMPFPLTMGKSRWSRVLLRLNQLLLKISKHLFSYEICVRARPVRAAQVLPKRKASDTVSLRPRLLGRVA